MSRLDVTGVFLCVGVMCADCRDNFQKAIALYGLAECLYKVSVALEELAGYQDDYLYGKVHEIIGMSDTRMKMKCHDCRRAD